MTLCAFVYIEAFLNFVEKVNAIPRLTLGPNESECERIRLSLLNDLLEFLLLIVILCNMSTLTGANYKGAPRPHLHYLICIL